MGTTLSRRAFVGRAAAAAFGAQAAIRRPRLAFASDDFAELDAVGQAELVRTGQATALELVDATIRRIEAVNPRLNAVVTAFFDKARNLAKGSLPDSQLSGVPYLIKDLDDFYGERRTSGSRLLASHVSERTGWVPLRAVNAGLIVVGKSNTPEFGLLASTEGILLGPCRNPWNLGYSTGGSSGGSAAAVASGMLPVAHASDGAGSIRIPASCCGVFGLKPSRGRMWLGPKRPVEHRVENCISRTVRDSAMVFSLSEDRSGPLGPIGFVAGPTNRRLTVALSTTDYFGKEPDPDVKRVVTEAARLCADLGHRVVEAGPSVDGERFTDAFVTLLASGAARIVSFAKDRGLKPEDVLEPWTIGLAEFHTAKPKGALEAASAYLREVEAAVGAFMERCDVCLTPVLSKTVPELGWQAPTVPFDILLDREVHYACYTAIHNVAGTPAMSVPLGMSADGLPIGCQFAAAMGGEGLLYALAYELERARPWARNRPPVYAL